MAQVCVDAVTGSDSDLFDFFVTAGQYENVAPQFGTHTLDDYFRALR